MQDVTTPPSFTNLLVTGPPGCGKSTLILRVVEKLSVPAAGFTTADIRGPGGAREGFRITALSGEEGMLASVRPGAGPRVGRYRVNIRDLETIGAAALERAVIDPAVALAVADEIARMELFSERFRRAVTAALEAPKPLLGTIQARRDPFLDSVKNRRDTRIITLERGKLDQAERRILEEISSMLRPDGA
jgi:nucleoside-triphosphatase